MILSVYEDTASGKRDRPHYQTEQSGFSAAIGASQTENVSFVCFAAYIFYNIAFPISAGNILQL